MCRLNHLLQIAYPFYDQHNVHLLPNLLQRLMIGCHLSPGQFHPQFVKAQINEVAQKPDEVEFFCSDRLVLLLIVQVGNQVNFEGELVVQVHNGQNCNY